MVLFPHCIVTGQVLVSQSEAFSKAFFLPPFFENGHHSLKKYDQAIALDPARPSQVRM